MRVCLDLCAIQRPLDDQSQLRVHAEAEAVRGLLALCEAGILDLVTSAAHVAETARNPHPDRRDYVLAVLARTRHYVATSAAVAERAARYRAAGLDPFDALHLASAVAAEAAYFCSTDDRLLRRAREVDTNPTAVVTPLELIVLLDRP